MAGLALEDIASVYCYPDLSYPDGVQPLQTRSLPGRNIPRQGAELSRARSCLFMSINEKVTTQNDLSQLS